MTKTLFSLAGLAVVSTALAVAQTVPPPAAGEPDAGQAGRAHSMMRRGGPGGFHRMAAGLNLTDDQKVQAKAIFQQSRTEAQPLAAQLRQARQDLHAASTANAPQTQIDQLSSKVGSLSGQMAAIRAKAFSKFYALLTPDQQAQLDARRQQFRNRAARGGNAWRHGWRQQQQAPPPAPQQ
jgi:Spy/CpxP family protein refolding chaperone